MLRLAVGEATRARFDLCWQHTLLQAIVPRPVQ